MAKSITITLSTEEKSSLEKIVRSPSSQVREVLRAKIVLLAAENISNQDISQRLGCNIETARLWRNRFYALRLKGLQDQPGRGVNCKLKMSHYYRVKLSHLEED